MWKVVFPNRRLRIAAKVILGSILIAMLFTLSATEVDYVYTGF